MLYKRLRLWSDRPYCVAAKVIESGKLDTNRARRSTLLLLQTVRKGSRG
jgi:hypothetical protein